MLTPDKIREKSFQTTGRGSYQAEEVDNFINEVAASYEALFAERSDLNKKLALLIRKVEEYREDEESLKMALINAQKLADKIVAEARETAEKESAEIKAETARLNEFAKKVAEEAEAKANEEAEKIIAEANAKAKEMIGNINRTVTHQSLVYEMLQKETADFKGKLIAMYKEHINLINQLPDIIESKLDEAEEAVEEAVEETVDETPVVIEEETPVVIEESVEDAVEETVDEVADEVVVEETTAESEDVAEAPAAKKTFKLDLSKIDFADDDEDFVSEPAADAVEKEEIFEETDSDDSDDDEPKSISFKNFFKKK